MKPCFHFLSSLSLCLLTLAPSAFGAACCGGGFAAPSLIVGDEKSRLTASYAYTNLVSDVGADTYWRKRDANESSETYKIEASQVFWDSWQAGLSVPFVRRSKAEAASTGLGDISATLGYEYLPDWDYNPWRPRGLGFLQLTAPTGKSVDEASATYQLDSRGRGYWAAGAGTILTKAWGIWDAFLSLDAHRSFSRQFQNSEFQGTLSPGYGGNAGFGGGWNFSALRLGAALTWSYEDPVATRGTLNSPGSLQRYATAAASASYMFGSLWAGTLSYVDQTKFGSPVNTSLGRGATLLVQRRWER